MYIDMQGPRTAGLSIPHEGLPKLQSVHCFNRGDIATFNLLSYAQSAKVPSLPVNANPNWMHPGLQQFYINTPNAYPGAPFPQMNPRNIQYVNGRPQMGFNNTNGLVSNIVPQYTSQSNGPILPFTAGTTPTMNDVEMVKQRMLMQMYGPRFNNNMMYQIPNMPCDPRFMNMHLKSNQTDNKLTVNRPYVASNTIAPNAIEDNGKGNGSNAQISVLSNTGSIIRKIKSEISNKLSADRQYVANDTHSPKAHVDKLELNGLNAQVPNMPCDPHLMNRHLQSDLADNNLNFNRQYKTNGTHSPKVLKEKVKSNGLYDAQGQTVPRQCTRCSQVSLCLISSQICIDCEKQLVVNDYNLLYLNKKSINNNSPQDMNREVVQPEIQGNDNMLIGDLPPPLPMTSSTSPSVSSFSSCTTSSSSSSPFSSSSSIPFTSTTTTTSSLSSVATPSCSPHTTTSPSSPQAPNAGNTYQKSERYSGVHICQYSDQNTANPTPCLVCGNFGRNREHNGVNSKANSNTGQVDSPMVPYLPVHIDPHSFLTKYDDVLEASFLAFLNNSSDETCLPTLDDSSSNDRDISVGETTNNEHGIKRKSPSADVSLDNVDLYNNNHKRTLANFQINKDRLEKFRTKVTPILKAKKWVNGNSSTTEQDS